MPGKDVIGEASELTVAGSEPARIRLRLLAVEPGRRRKAIMVRHLAELAAEVLGAPPGRIDPAEPLMALGLDSATMLALRSRLENSLGVTLPATVGWRFPTLEALAPHLAERMGIDLDAAK